MVNLNRTRYDNVKDGLKKSLTYIGAIIIVRILWFLISSSKGGAPSPIYTAPAHSPNINEIISSACDSVNKNTPYMIDSLTELEGIHSVGDREIEYDFKLNLNIPSYNVGKVKKSIDKLIMDSSLTSNVSNKTFIDSGITFIYKYVDKSNKLLFKSTFPPSTYKPIQTYLNGKITY